jgi:hypothetical protein
MNTIFFRLFLHEERGWPANGILVQLFSCCWCFRWSYRVRYPASTRIYRKLEATLYRWGCTLIYAKYRSVHFYLAQGIPTVLLGVGCFFFLPDRPESTIYLTKEEQKLATDRMSRDASRDNGAFINKSKSIVISTSYEYLNCLWEHIWAAFQDWRVGAVPWTNLHQLLMGS